MCFREKSAWLMLIILGLTGAGYAVIVAIISKAIGQLVPPLFPLLVFSPWCSRSWRQAVTS